MRIVVLILITLFACQTAFAGPKLKELKNQHHHNKKMKQAAHSACKEQSGGHQILHHHK